MAWMSPRKSTPFQESPPEYISAKVAAQMMGISRSHLFAQRKAGKFPSPIRIGRCVRYHRATILAWAAANTPSLERWKNQQRIAA